MARNGSGTYSLPAGNPVVDDTDVTVTWGNDTMNDIATALTNSLATNGESVVTANIPMAGYKLTGSGVATALTDLVTATDVQKGTPTYLTSVAGTADAITATGPYSMAAYTTGMRVAFVVASTNTAAATLTINAIAGGAKAITKHGVLALAAGDLVAASTVELMYDGTRFQIIGAAPIGQTPLGGASSSDHGNSGTTTQDLAYSAGAVHKIKATGNFTITTSAWPATGTLGEMLLWLIADGTGRTITWPTINFVKSDGTFAATPALAGVTLQTANLAIDFVVLWSLDAGTTIYGKIVR